MVSDDDDGDGDWTTLVTRDACASLSCASDEKWNLRVGEAVEGMRVRLGEDVRQASVWARGQSERECE